MASASSSDMFVATVKPSHHKVVAGLEPPATVGALVNFVLLSISGVEPSPSVTGPARDPHKLVRATFPASQSA